MEITGMKRNLLVAAVILLAVVLAFFFLPNILQKPKEPVQLPNQTQMNKATAGIVPADVFQQINDIHLSMDPKYLSELEGIIKGNATSYTRERAVFVYSDIASQTGNDERALGFLKDIAYNESNDEVRTAAYANYDFIKQHTETEPSATLDVSLNGTMAKGSNITLVLNITAMQALPEAYAMIKPQGNLDSQTMAKNTKQLSLKANESMLLPFVVELCNEDKCIIKARLKVIKDRLDYEEIERSVYIDLVNSSYLIK